jgi:hypothetical protein
VIVEWLKSEVENEFIFFIWCIVPKI